jgi:DNA repair protein RadC
MHATLHTVEAQDDVEVLQALTRAPRKQLAAAMLANSGLRGLVQASDAKLQEHLSLEVIKTLRAAFELPKRFETARDTRPRLSTPMDCNTLFRPHLAHLPHERFMVASLNARNTLVLLETVADGSVDQCHVDPRRVFAGALQAGASAIVLAHNHPGGSAEPSSQDIALTNQLRQAGRTLCIRLVDHLVIAADGFVSLLARGYVSTP